MLNSHHSIFDDAHHAPLFSSSDGGLTPTEATHAPKYATSMTYSARCSPTYYKVCALINSPFIKLNICQIISLNITPSFGDVLYINSTFTYYWALSFHLPDARTQTNKTLPMWFKIFKLKQKRTSGFPVKTRLCGHERNMCSVHTICVHIQYKHAFPNIHKAGRRLK